MKPTDRNRDDEGDSCWYKRWRWDDSKQNGRKETTIAACAVQSFTPTMKERWEMLVAATVRVYTLYPLISTNCKIGATAAVLMPKGNMRVDTNWRNANKHTNVNGEKCIENFGSDGRKYSCFFPEFLSPDPIRIRRNFDSGDHVHIMNHSNTVK